MRYGILGGAFNPFHSEHARMVEEAKKALGLDKIILVPTLNPPHKENSDTPYADRVKMLELWAKNRSYIIVDRIESELHNIKNCTYLVLPELFKKYPSDSEFVYIIGGDSMLMFHTWVKPEVISKEVKLAVIKREGFADVDGAVVAARRDYGADIVVTDICCREVSSSELWAKLQLGMDTKDEIPMEIEEYIKENNLFASHKDLVERVKNSGITEGLFKHMARTAVYAASHARAIKVDVEKAFLTGLMHDIAKERKPLFPIDEYETKAPKVIHQYDGATVAEKEFGFTDEEMLDAIRYHTTGRPNMTALGKLIYAADKLESARDYEGVEEIRAAIDEDFDKGFVMLLKRNIAFLKSKGANADGITAECFEYYTNKK